jgi:2-polyprenyl-3-methyl-5-hydroxy-6-metoxy-1,4-benzoquinol methylase
MTKKDPYIKNDTQFEALRRKFIRDYDPAILPETYGYLVQEDQLQLVIRLARYKFVTKMLSKTDRVLEVGSGSGLGTIFLGQHCKSVKGLEFKKSVVAQARKLNRRKNVEFLQGDFFDYADPGLFDAIVNLDVIEHMPQKVGEKLIAKTAKHLKDTGMLILGTPSIYSYEFQSPMSKAGHIKCYDQKELVGLVEKHYGRVLAFSMNDELVHTGFHKLAWYYFILAFCPKHT